MSLLARIRKTVHRPTTQEKILARMGQGGYATDLYKKTHHGLK